MAEKANDKPRAVRSHDVALDKEYVQWIQDIKQRFHNSQIKAAVKVNSEQLLFNWQLGRDLVVRKAEEKWGGGIVEQVSLDLQAEFPNAKGFSARNLWFIKQWYSFYALKEETALLIEDIEGGVRASGIKLNQVGSEIQEQELNQAGSEMPFPTIFAYVPWKHHVLIMQKCKTIEEALFYVRRTVEEGLNRNALDNSIRADAYHSMGAAITYLECQVPTYKCMKICFPPVDEQIEIADYIDEKSAEIDKLVTKKEQFLAELESYKKSMIYEYVTGKKEVPHA